MVGSVVRALVLIKLATGAVERGGAERIRRPTPARSVRANGAKCAEREAPHVLLGARTRRVKRLARAHFCSHSFESTGHRSSQFFSMRLHVPTSAESASRSVSCRFWIRPKHAWHCAESRAFSYELKAGSATLGPSTRRHTAPIVTKIAAPPHKATRQRLRTSAGMADERPSGLGVKQTALRLKRLI